MIYLMNDLKIRRFETKDVSEVFNLIERNILDADTKVYSEKEIQRLASYYNENKILHTSKKSHMYVIILKNKVVACGSISNYLGRDDESILFDIFVLPELQGKGIGKKLIEALENDEYFLKSRRVEVPSSPIVCDFYKKMGYDHKYSLKELDKDGNFKLEKFRYKLQYDQNY